MYNRLSSFINCGEALIRCKLCKLYVKKTDFGIKINKCRFPSDTDFKMFIKCNNWHTRKHFCVFHISHNLYLKVKWCPARVQSL